MGKISVQKWKDITSEVREFSPLDNRLPDFGQIVHSQLGKKPIKLTLFDNSCYIMQSGNNWFIVFITRACAVSPFLRFKEEYIGTLELGAVGKRSAFATAARFQEGLAIRARYDLRYWSEKTKEWVVPFELATAAQQRVKGKGFKIN